MKINFINHFKITIFSIVLIVFNAAQAGSYDDFFKAVKMDDAKAVLAARIDRVDIESA